MTRSKQILQSLEEASVKVSPPSKKVMKELCSDLDVLQEKVLDKFKIPGDNDARMNSPHSPYKGYFDMYNDLKSEYPVFLEDFYLGWVTHWENWTP